MTTEKKLRMVCPECGSTGVVRDAYAEWDEEEQDWVLLAVYDHAACNECGKDDITIIEEEI